MNSNNPNSLCIKTGNTNTGPAQDKPEVGAGDPGCARGRRNTARSACERSKGGEDNSKWLELCAGRVSPRVLLSRTEGVKTNPMQVRPNTEGVEPKRATPCNNKEKSRVENSDTESALPRRAKLLVAETHSPFDGSLNIK